MWAIRGQNYLWLFMLAVNSLTPEARVMAQQLEVAGSVCSSPQLGTHWLPPSPLCFP